MCVCLKFLFAKPFVYKRLHCLYPMHDSISIFFIASRYRRLAKNDCLHVHPTWMYIVIQIERRWKAIRPNAFEISESDINSSLSFGSLLLLLLLHEFHRKKRYTLRWAFIYPTIVHRRVDVLYVKKIICKKKQQLLHWIFADIRRAVERENESKNRFSFSSLLLAVARAVYSIHTAWYLVY